MTPTRRAMMGMMAGISAGPGLLSAAEAATARSAFEPVARGANVRDFGAVGDGRTDDTAAIQAAIDALAVAGGEIAFPPGSYRHAGLTIGAAGQTVGGGLRLRALGLAANPSTVGQEGVRLLCTSPTATHLQITDADRVEVDGLAFAPAPGVTPTAGHGVHVLRGNRLVLHQVRFDNTYNTLTIQENKETVVRNVDCQWVRGDYGLSIFGSASRVISTCDFERLFIGSRIDKGDNRLDGVRIGAHCNTGRWGGLRINDCRRGLVIGEGVTDQEARPLFHWFNDLDVEQSTDVGVLLVTGAFLWFTNAYTCVNSQGVRVASTFAISAKALGGPVWFNRCMIASNGRDGVLLEGCPQISFLGCQIANNSAADIALNGTKGPAKTYDGIRVTAPRAFLDVIGCRLGGNAFGQADTTGQQRYGLHLAPTVSDPRLRIIGNDLSGNASGSIDDRSAATATKVVFGNLGPGLQGTERHDLGVVAATSIRPVFEVPVHGLTAAGDVEIDLSAAGFPAGRLGTIEVVIRMDSAGGHAVAFSGVTHWHDGARPRLATAAGAINRLTFCSDDGGRTVMGRLVFRSRRPA